MQQLDDQNIAIFATGASPEGAERPEGTALLVEGRTPEWMRAAGVRRSAV